MGTLERMVTFPESRSGRMKLRCVNWLTNWITPPVALVEGHQHRLCVLAHLLVIDRLDRRGRHGQGADKQMREWHAGSVCTRCAARLRAGRLSVGFASRRDRTDSESGDLSDHDKMTPHSTRGQVREPLRRSPRQSQRSDGLESSTAVSRRACVDEPFSLRAFAPDRIHRSPPCGASLRLPSAAAALDLGAGLRFEPPAHIHRLRVAELGRVDPDDGSFFQVDVCRRHAGKGGQGQGQLRLVTDERDRS